MKKITILSGKGGVGKSSITASLALTLAKDKKIICADCDIDASNLALVLGGDKYEEWVDLSTNEKIEFDMRKCNSCKKCYNECYFNAIGWKDNKPYLKDFSCEGCGLCSMVCPEGAIKLIKVNNAKLGYSTTKYNFKVVSAQLNPGASGSGKVVFETRKRATELAGNSEIMLIDSAAGIGCPVIASVTGTDYAIIVTEPTPSGFSDMKRALDIVKHFNISCGIIINKFDINDKFTEEIRSFSKINNIEVLAEIPFDKQFAKALVAMIPIVKYDNKYETIFNNIKSKLLSHL